MKKILGIERNHFLLITGCWLAVHFILYQVYGIRDLHDSTRYLNAARIFLTTGTFNEVESVFYSVPILLIALSELVFDSVVPLLIFQITLSLFAAIALYMTSAQLFQTNLAGIFSALIYLCWVDNIHWSLTVMTESLFASIACFLMYLLVSGRKRSYAAILITLLILFGTRPTGVLYVTAVTVFLFLNQNRKSLIGVIAACTFIIGMFIIMLSRWDFSEQLVKGNIVTYADIAPEIGRSGIQIDPGNVDHLQTGRHPAVKILLYAGDNPVIFLKAFLMKVVYLLTGYRPYYSFAHNVFSTAWMFAIYILFTLGLINSKNRNVRIFSLLLVVLTCLLTGVSTVDWDNRFFIPMFPIIALSAGGGACFTIGRLRTSISTEV